MQILRKKQRVSLLALLATAVFFLSEAASFIQPVTAMAATKLDAGTVGEKYEMGKIYLNNGKGRHACVFEGLTETGTKPDGIKLETGNESNGELYWHYTGTPIKTGTYTFGFNAKAIMNNNSVRNVERQYTLTINNPTEEQTETAADDDDDDDDDHHGDGKILWSADSLTARYFADGKYATNLKVGKIQQGDAAKALFSASKPAGWSEAFSFNLSFDDKTDYTLKNGILTLYIPHDMIKTGRQYALMGIDQAGLVHIYTDTDAALGSVTTAPLNLQGYAMVLIYKD